LSALGNGFRILDAITASGAGLTFSEIVERSGVPKATVHRLLRELVWRSALAYDEPTRLYTGGLALARLGASVMQNYDVRRVVRPHLEALHDATGSVATLGIRDGGQGIYVDKIEPAGVVIRLHSEIGKSFPLHCTAMGKVLLAHSDAATIGKVLRRKLKAYTPNTITDGKRLRAELNTVARQGYAVDREEITRGLVCVAAPIYGIDGDVEAAISCTVSSFDADKEFLEQVREHVTHCAEAASN
jgi:DNA-binding IclR family transcriptional regulator